jgi:hypothetical protein
MEWPNGATKVARDTCWASMADGHPDECPTEGGRVPNGGWTGAQWRANGCPTEGRSQGWPDGGVYKSC